MIRHIVYLLWYPKTCWVHNLSKYISNVEVRSSRGKGLSKSLNLKWKLSITMWRIYELNLSSEKTMITGHCQEVLGRWFGLQFQNYILTKVNLKIGLEYCYYISILCAWELGQQTQYMFQGERKGKFQKCLLCDYWKSYSTLHKVLQAIDV